MYVVFGAPKASVCCEHSPAAGALADHGRAGIQAAGLNMGPGSRFPEFKYVFLVNGGYRPIFQLK